METYKIAVAAKTAQLIARGYKPELAAKCAKKFCKALHPLHKASVARRIEMADTAIEMTGEFHTA